MRGESAPHATRTIRTLTPIGRRPLMRSEVASSLIHRRRNARESGPPSSLARLSKLGLIPCAALFASVVVLVLPTSAAASKGLAVGLFDDASVFSPTDDV